MTVTVTVRHQLVLAGHVVDGVGGQPLPGARVELVVVPAALAERLAAAKLAHAGWDDLAERPDRTRTDARGRFLFLDLPSGSYGLAATLPSAGSRYGKATASAEVVRNQQGDATLAFVELALAPTRITGTVRGPGPKPLALATVRTADGTESTFTDALGVYALVAVEAGPRRLLVTAAGHAPATAVASLAGAGATHVVDVQLTVP